jgi:hypothetical protein
MLKRWWSWELGLILSLLVVTFLTSMLNAGPSGGDGAPNAQFPRLDGVSHFLVALAAVFVTFVVNLKRARPLNLWLVGIVTSVGLVFLGYTSLAISESGRRMSADDFDAWLGRLMAPGLILALLLWVPSCRFRRIQMEKTRSTSSRAGQESREEPA